MEPDIIPLELVEQMLRDNCALFVGAGLTLAEGYGLDLNELVTDLARYCEQGIPGQDFAKVAEYYELSVDRPSLIEKYSNWIEGKTGSPSGLDQMIARLPFRFVITTRTDLMLEDAYRQAKKSLVKVVSDAEVAFGDSQKVLLLKVHGSIDQKEALVLTDSDHLNLLNKRRLLSEFIKLLYAVKTVLFIGHDLDDQYSRLLHREILQEMGQFSRKAYAVWEGASAYLVKFWGNSNVKIIDCNTLEFLRVLELKLSSFKTEHRTLKKARTKRPHANPYKFLEHFETDDEDLFFGRKLEIELLSKRILAHRLLVLYGRSGVGKTSLINAGLIPELEEFDAFSICARCLDAPVRAVEKAITDAFTSSFGWALEIDGDTPDSLFKLLMKAQQAVGKRIVLFVDQLEELFRLPYEMQQEVVKQLSICVSESSLLDIRVVLCLRDDFFSDLDTLRDHLPYVFLNVNRLQDLSETAAVEAIVRPLGLFETRVEEQLVELLIKDLKSEGSIAPAQLQIVCSKLYEKFAGEGTITIEHYRNLGEAKEILGIYLEEVLERFSAPLRGTARRILQALVTSKKTKKLLSTPEIARYLALDSSQIERVVSPLEDYRLIRKVETEEGHKYEVVHEYLVQQVWQWISQDEAKIKEVQEIVDTDTRYWPKYRTPISRQKLDAVYECWNRLVLNEEHMELLFRSSIAFGFLKQWNEIAVSLAEKLVPLYIRLLQDTDVEVVRLASVALAKLGAIDELNQALTKVDPYRQSYVRRALRQLEEGRSDEDLAAELSNAEWKEKSLWNTSSMVGIDFGTTVSVVAVMRNDKPVIIPNREGSKFTPSIVAFGASGEVVVGTPASLQAATNPDRTVFSIKRHLGTDWKILIGHTTYTAVDIAALIFKSLKQEAESYLERDVSQAVIGVPAYFDNKQRRSLLEAAQRAGLEVNRLVAEPTAASLAYGLNLKYDQTAAVYDLGGGTFDISLMELGDGVAEVKAVNGDTNLGGDDFDERVIGYLIGEFRKRHGIDLSSDKVARVRLKEAAERAKITLSGLETVNIYIPYIHADKSGITHLDVDLTRSRFEELTSDLVEKTLDCCKAAIEDAGLSNALKDVELVLVGLSTKMPLIRQSVSALFGKEPRRGVDPDEAVALGLAIQAGVLSGTVRGQLLLDATPISLGIETLGGVFTKLIERNTTIPTRKSEIFSTASDNQSSVEVHVLQGERSMANQNRTLCKLKLVEIPAAPRGVPQIEVTFDIDQNGILGISAKDLGTAKEQRIVVDFASGDWPLGNQSTTKTGIRRQPSGQSDLVILAGEIYKTESGTKPAATDDRTLAMRKSKTEKSPKSE